MNYEFSSQAFRYDLCAHHPHVFGDYRLEDIPSRSGQAMACLGTYLVPTDQLPISYSKLCASHIFKYIPPWAISSA